jgi:hypothetical protein
MDSRQWTSTAFRPSMYAVMSSRAYSPSVGNTHHAHQLWHIGEVLQPASRCRPGSPGGCPRRRPLDSVTAATRRGQTECPSGAIQGSMSSETVLVRDSVVPSDCVATRCSLGQKVSAELASLEDTWPAIYRGVSVETRRSCTSSNRMLFADTGFRLPGGAPESSTRRTNRSPRSCAMAPSSTSALADESDGGHCGLRVARSSQPVCEVPAGIQPSNTDLSASGWN